MFRSLLSDSFLDDRDLHVQLLGALDGPELALEVVDTQEWRYLDDVDDAIEAGENATATANGTNGSQT
ncbi:hypothetical protein [Halopenitus sp. POP-27]|uniref:hypothetical protein n=1 Tax=Halopenitus sp. POP-27 TaxID=2994425 RepID=UPI00246898DA|nr:hypothetical protein [Halopenitus sp. POP-27]